MKVVTLSKANVKTHQVAPGFQGAYRRGPRLSRSPIRQPLLEDRPHNRARCTRNLAGGALLYDGRHRAEDPTPSGGAGRARPGPAGVIGRQSRQREG